MMYRSVFGECTWRDMAMFEFTPETPWRQRWKVRWATMKNWCAETWSDLPTQTVHFQGNLNMIDGCFLVGAQQVYDLHKSGFTDPHLGQATTDLDTAVGHSDVVIMQQPFAYVATSKLDGRVLYTLDMLQSAKTQKSIEHLECDPIGSLAVGSHDDGHRHDYLWMIIDTRTGATVSSIIPDTPMQFSSVPRILDSKIYAMNMKGDSLYVFDAKTGKSTKKALPPEPYHRLECITDKFVFVWARPPAESDGFQLYLLDRRSLSSVHTFAYNQLSTQRDADARIGLFVTDDHHTRLVSFDGRIFHLHGACLLSGMSFVFCARWLVRRSFMSHLVDIVDLMPRRHKRCRNRTS